MVECLEKINTEYEPIFVCTDISDESNNVLELNSLLCNHIKYYNEEKAIESKIILEDLIFYNLMKNEKIEKLKNKYANDKIFSYDKETYFSNEEYIKKLFLNGKLLEGMYESKTNNEKEKILVIVFGNESRGVSKFIKQRSNHKIVIPHFGHRDTSYNLSVSCGMILFYLYSIKLLPGNFTDYTKEKGCEVLVKNMINSFQGMPRSEIKKFGLENDLEDY